MCFYDSDGEEGEPNQQAPSSARKTVAESKLRGDSQSGVKSCGMALYLPPSFHHHPTIIIHT